VASFNLAHPVDSRRIMSMYTVLASQRPGIKR